MKKKLSHLFLALIIGIAFAVAYAFIVYEIYTLVTQMGGKFLAKFVPIPFALGMLVFYSFHYRWAKRFFFYGIGMLHLLCFLYFIHPIYAKKCFCNIHVSESKRKHAVSFP